MCTNCDHLFDERDCILFLSGIYQAVVQLYAQIAIFIDALLNVDNPHFAQSDI